MGSVLGKLCAVKSAPERKDRGADVEKHQPPAAIRETEGGANAVKDCSSDENTREATKKGAHPRLPISPTPRAKNPACRAKSDAMRG